MGLVVNGRGFSRPGEGTRLLGAVLVDTVLVTSTGGTTGVFISSIRKTLKHFVLVKFFKQNTYYP